MNPVPGVEFEGQLGEADDFEALWHQKFNHNIVPWQIARTKWLAMKQITKSSIPILHDCPISNIDPNAPCIHGYKTHYTAINLAANMSTRVNKACWWHSTLQFVISLVQILYFWNSQGCHQKDSSLLFWQTSLSLEYLALSLFRQVIACGNSYMWLRLKL